MDLNSAVWRKSPSSSNAGNCVEVAVNLPGVVAVRDSKDPHGPALTFTPADWHAFTTRLRAGIPARPHSANVRGASRRAPETETLHSSPLYYCGANSLCVGDSQAGNGMI